MSSTAIAAFFAYFQSHKYKQIAVYGLKYVCEVCSHIWANQVKEIELVDVMPLKLYNRDRDHIAVYTPKPNIVPPSYD